MLFCSARGVKRTPAALACAALIALAAIPGDAQSQRVPGPPADTFVDVLITFRSLPGQADEALVRGLGGTPRYRYHLVPGIAARLPAQAVAALQANPRVVVVEPDGQVFAIGHAAELANTWGVAHIGSGEVHHAPGVLGSGVLVGVIDSGIDYTHPDLQGNYAFGHNFVNGSTNPMDDNGHGTHVAGTIAALKNGAGVVGVAPAARLVGLKVLNATGSGQWSHIIAAVQYAVDNGIRITNNSYGGGSDPGSLVQAAFDTSAAAGVLHIAAAGNSGTCSGNTNSVGWPARYDSVVAVAAVNSSNSRPCFSSTGPALELAAPGVSINSTIPGGGYASYNGTSMASPHVAGVAALLTSTDQTLDASGIRQLLRDTAQPLGNTSQYGRGLVNAVAAVAAAGPGAGDPPPSDPIPPPGDDDNQGPQNATATISTITYSSHGGPQSNRHLSATVMLESGSGSPVAGASVSIRLSKGGSSMTATATTGSNGTVSFTWTNAPAGCHTTTVTAVVAGGFSWDGATPENGTCGS